MKKLILLILFIGSAPAFSGDFDSDCLDQNNEGREFVQEENNDVEKNHTEEAEVEMSGSDA